MSDVVENRIVEMQFDNKDFEQNAATSIRTLEQLDKSLEFKNSSKGFEEIQQGMRNLDFSGLHDNISSIDNAFTSLAGSIERNFLDRISNGLLDMGQNLWNNTIGQIQAGGKRRAMNIEQAQFKIKGLKGDWDELYEDMDYAVSGTAYGIDAAASAAAQFFASGIKSGDDMKAALRGISGVAAMTSSSFEEIARVMTAAAGKGRVQQIELTRLSLRGINAAAALAKYMGVTESEIRAMTKKGTIDFQTFANAMDAAFGEHAKKANETFTGSLSNVKAALSRIGEIWYEPWLDKMIVINNALRKGLNKIIAALKNDIYPIRGELRSFKEILADLHGFSGRIMEEFIKTFEPALTRLPYRLEHVVNGMEWLRGKMKDAVNTLKEVNNMLNNPWDFERNIATRMLKADESITKEEWKIAKEMVAAKQYNSDYQIKADEKQMKLIKEKGLSLEHVQKVVDALTSKEQKYLDGITQAEINYANKIYNSGKYNSKTGILYKKAYKDEMQELGLDAERVQKYLDKLTTGEDKMIQRTYGHTKAASVVVYIYEEFYKAEKLFNQVSQKVQKIVKAISDSFKIMNKVFAKNHSELPSIMDFFRNLVHQFKVTGRRFKAIKEITKGLIAIAEIVFYYIQKVFGKLNDLVNSKDYREPVILEFLGKFGRFFTNLAHHIIKGKEMPSIIDTLKDAFGGLWDSIKNLVGKESMVGKIFTTIKNIVVKAITAIKNVVGGLLQGIGGDPNKEGSGLGGILSSIISMFIPEGGTINLNGVFSGIFGGIKKFIGGVFDVIQGLLGFAKTVANSLSKVFDFVWGIVSKQGDNISDLLTAMFGFFTRMFNEGLKPGAFEKIGEVATAVADAVIAIFTTIKDIVLAIKDPAIAICKSVADILKSFTNTVSTILDTVAADPEAAYGAAAFFAIIDLIKTGIENRGKGKTSFFKTIKSLPLTIKEFFGSVADSLRMIATETPLDKLKKFANSVLKISIAMFLMMASFTNLFGLGNDKNGNKTTQQNGNAIVSSVLVVAGVITALLIVLKKVSTLSSIGEDVKVGFITLLLNSLASTIIRIAIGFAIVSLAVKKVGAEDTWMSAGIFVVILGMLYLAIAAIINKVDNIAKLSKESKNAIAGIGIVLLMMGLSVLLITASIVGMMMAFASLKTITGDTGEAISIMGVLMLFIVAIMGMLLLVINTIGKNGPKISTIKTKNLIGMAVIMLVMGIVVKMMASSIIKIATFLVLTKDIESVAIAFGLIAGLMLIMAGMFWVLQKTGTGANGSSALMTMLGFSAVILMLGHILKTIALVIIAFKAMNVTAEDMEHVGILFGAVVAAVAVIGLLSIFMQGGAAKSFYLIALGIAAIAKAVELMAKAMWIVIKSFIVLALIYPTIKPVIPEMMADIKEKLPEFIAIVGAAFRQLMVEILKSAPLIAAVVVEVMLLVALALNAKAPIIVAAWLTSLNTIIDLLLVGSSIILPKLLALALIFLGYLDANAVMFGEKLTSILLKVIFGAAMAITHFFDDFLPKWVEENFDKLNTGIVKYLSEHNAFYDSIGDMIYRMMNGQSLEEDLAALDEGMVWDAKRGMYIDTKNTTIEVDEESLKKAEEEAIKKATEEAKQHVEEEPMIYKLGTPSVLEQPVDVHEIVSYAGMSDEESKKIEDSVKKSTESVAEAQKAQSIKSEAEAGTEGAKSYSTSFLGGLLGEGGLSDGLSNVFGNLTGTAGDAGTEAGNAFGGNFMDSLSNFSIGEGGFDLKNLTGGGQLMNATANFDAFASAENIEQMTGTSFEAEMNERTGTAGVNNNLTDLNMIDENQSMLGSVTNTAANSGGGALVSVINKLKDLIQNVGDKVEDTVVVAKDTKINITSMMDTQKVAETTYPFIDTLDARQEKFASNKLARGKK